MDSECQIPWYAKQDLDIGLVLRKICNLFFGECENSFDHEEPFSIPKKVLGLFSHTATEAHGCQDNYCPVHDFER